MFTCAKSQLVLARGRRFESCPQRLKLIISSQKSSRKKHKIIERIREICNKEKASFPKIEFNEHYFYVSFKQSREYLKLASRKVTEKVTENQIRILEEIRKNKYVTTKYMSSVIGISERKIKENIRKLKEKGLLKRVGPAKGGYWKVLEDENNEGKIERK